MIRPVPSREPAWDAMGAPPIRSSPLPGLGPLRAAARLAALVYLATRTALRARPPASDRSARLREGAAHLQRVSRRLLFLHGVQLDVRGEVPASPAILASNHVSYMDPVLISAACQGIPIAKAESARWPLVGVAMRSIGVLFVDRSRKGGGASPARAARGAIEAGLSVVNFAEGTTTDGTRLARFQVGLFRLARKLEVPVVPVHVGYRESSMAWVGDATFVPHYLRFAARSRTRARVTFCPPIQPLAAATAAELAAATRASIADVAGLRLDV